MKEWKENVREGVVEEEVDANEDNDEDKKVL
jgi:hypothetical protein